MEKAFDTVNHHILISKLNQYGISGKSKDWIASYLRNRTQQVKLNGVKSNDKIITCGVPQGSILGPLLFTIYINDMHKALPNSSVFHFADDTNLLFSSTTSKKIHKVINNELKLLFDWLCANRLSLNVAKTEFIIFRPPRKKLEKRIYLTLNGVKLYESPKIKYLGIILDNRLTWKHHIHELSKKLNRAVGMIYKIRDNCTRSVLRSLYFSLFNSHLSYGIPVWGKSIYSHKLLLIQKKIVRAISFSKYSAPTKPIFKDLNILRFDDIFKSQIASRGLASPNKFEVWIDGGHNEAAAQALGQVTKTSSDKPLYLILGMINSKNIYKFLKPLQSYIKELRAVAIPNEKSSFSAKEIEKKAQSIGIKSESYDGLKDALNFITKKYQEKNGGRVLIWGALYLVGHALELNRCTID